MIEFLIWFYRHLKSKRKPSILTAEAEYLFWKEFVKTLERPESLFEMLLYDYIMHKVGRRIDELELLVDIGIDVMGYLPYTKD